MLTGKSLSIHALIPARGGSKSISRKNIHPYRERPLLVHSIEIGLQCPYITRVVVSTDDKEIQQIAQEHGAEAPFLRPSCISGDHSTDFECFRHYLSWLRFAKQEPPDVLVHLRPTYPERDLSLLNHCIATFLKVRGVYDSLRTVIAMEKSPFKMYLAEDGQLKPLFRKFRGMNEPYNQVRQVLPTCYLHNGYVDILNRMTIEQQKSMTGMTIYPYIMHKAENLDIDTHQDMEQSLIQGTSRLIHNEQDELQTLPTTYGPHSKSVPPDSPVSSPT